jgi:hypothetical protein
MNTGSGWANRALLIGAVTLVAVGGFATLLLTRATGPVDPQMVALRSATPQIGSNRDSAQCGRITNAAELSSN